jgi:hypothetical protein
MKGPASGIFVCELMPISFTPRFSEVFVGPQAPENRFNGFE